MSSTNFYTGFYDQKKTSSKVLKPPGGESSDIFGNDAPSTPRQAKKHNMSNIFAAPEPVNKTGENKKHNNADSHNRLFGEVQRPQTPSRNVMKSNIPIGSGAIANGDGVDAPPARSNGTANGKCTPVVATNGNGVAKNGNGHAYGNGNATNGNGVARSDSGGDLYINKKDMNDGYKSASPMEINTPSTNGAAKQIINKNRIPPGGFSSGFW